MSRRLLTALLALTLFFAGCRATPSSPPAAHTFTDAHGRTVAVSSLSRVVALYGSVAEVWLNGGGTLTGVTEDLMRERGITPGDGVQVVGTVKEPNRETLLALDPTLVLLSADIAAHAALGETLTALDIPHAYIRIDSFADYLTFLATVTAMTGRADLYEENGTAVAAAIEAVKARVPSDKTPTVLLLRAYSTGVKAKSDDNFTGIMLQELGCVNVADRYPSLLEELSLEIILAADPSFIFVTTMGDEGTAMESFHRTFSSSPAWQGLSAVKNGQVHLLPKDLFHYKPNARWAESYTYLAARLYPDTFA